jgi:hypothetical protein
VHSCVGLWGLVSVLMSAHRYVDPHTPSPPLQMSKTWFLRPLLVCWSHEHTDPVALKLNPSHVLAKSLPPSHAQDLVSRSTEKPPLGEPGG